MIYTAVFAVPVVDENSSFPKWDSLDPVLGSTVALEQGDLILLIDGSDSTDSGIINTPDWSYGPWSQAVVSVHHGDWLASRTIVFVTVAV